MHGISAILGKPGLVARFLAEILSWKDLTIVDLSIDEELAASEIAEKISLDFDNELHYYFAKKMRIPIVSFDKTYVQRLESAQVKTG